MCNPEFSSLRHAFIVALEGDECAWIEVTAALEPILSPMIRKKTSDLPDDLRDEVLCEVWLSLLQRTPRHFIESGQTVVVYVVGLVPNAITSVYAAYRPPGEPSRARRRKNALNVLPPTSLLDAVVNTVVPSWSIEWDRIDARIDMDRVEEIMDVRVLPTIRWLRDNDGSFAEACRSTGLSRAHLYRALDAVASRLN